MRKSVHFVKQTICVCCGRHFKVIMHNEPFSCMNKYPLILSAIPSSPLLRRLRKQQLCIKFKQLFHLEIINKYLFENHLRGVVKILDVLLFLRALGSPYNLESINNADMLIREIWNSQKKIFPKLGDRVLRKEWYLSKPDIFIDFLL